MATWAVLLAYVIRDYVWLDGTMELAFSRMVRAEEREAMSSEAVKAGQIIADEFLRRIAKRYENCNLRIYPDMPTLTPVEAVLRCAQEEGFILTNVIPGGPVGGAGELTAGELAELWGKTSKQCRYGYLSTPSDVWWKAFAFNVNAALAAKAPQRVPARVTAQMVRDARSLVGPAGTGPHFDWWEWYGKQADEINKMLTASASSAPALSVPVSDDTIHHGMVPPARCNKLMATTGRRCQKNTGHVNGCQWTKAQEDRDREAAAPKPAPPTESEVEAAKASMRSRGVVCDAVSTPHPYAICSCTEGHRNARLAEPIVSPSPMQASVQIICPLCGTAECKGHTLSASSSTASISSGMARDLDERATPAPGAERAALRERITEYLANGGLFNPENMEHAKVRELLRDVREALAAAPPAPEQSIRDFIAQEIKIATGDRHASAERVRNKVQTWANNCAVTEEHHRLNDNLEGAAYHRGAKGAYQRVVDEILALPPSTGEKQP